MNLVEVLDTPDREEQVDDNEGGKDIVLLLSSESGCFALENLTGTEIGEAKSSEFELSESEVVFLLDHDLLKLWGGLVILGVIERLFSTFLKWGAQSFLLLIGLFLLLIKLIGLLGGGVDGPGNSHSEKDSLSLLTEEFSEHDTDGTSHEDTWHDESHDLIVDGVSLRVLWVHLFEVEDESE